MAVRINTTLILEASSCSRRHSHCPYTEKMARQNHLPDNGLREGKSHALNEVGRMPHYCDVSDLILILNDVDTILGLKYDPILNS
jgi:hypothetical protein